MSAVVNIDSRRAQAEPSAEPAPSPLAIAPNDRILRMKSVRDRVGLSRATIYRRMLRSEFPASVPLGGHIVGWRESDINAWIAARGTGGAQ
jgi:prophage regulatory protein